ADGSGQYLDSTARDEVWIAVKLTIDGSTVRYIECLEKQYNGDEDLQEQTLQGDSGLTLNGAGNTVIDITGITNADPAVVTTDGAHGLSNGDRIRIVRVVGFKRDTGDLDAENNTVYES